MGHVIGGVKVGEGYFFGGLGWGEGGGLCDGWGCIPRISELPRIFLGGGR